MGMTEAIVSGGLRRLALASAAVALVAGAGGCGGARRVSSASAPGDGMPRTGHAQGTRAATTNARSAVFTAAYPGSVTSGVASLTGGQTKAIVASLPFAAVTQVVTLECQATADAVGYAIPCPTQLPLGMTVTSPVSGDSCGRFAFVAGGLLWSELNPRCSSYDRRAFRWFFGTSGVNQPGSGNATFQHLVIQGAPAVIGEPDRVIDLPAPYVKPEAVLPRGKMTIDRIVRRFYMVPVDNPSAMRSHLAVVWSQGGHTYAYSFHVTDGVSKARALDIYLLRHLRLIEPHHIG